MAIFSVISEGTEIKRHWSNIALFHTPLHLKPPIGVVSEYCHFVITFGIEN